MLELALWLGKDARFSTCSATSRCARCWRRAPRWCCRWIFGPPVIRWLAAKKIGQAVRDDGPKSHLTKPARRPWAGR